MSVIKTASELHSALNLNELELANCFAQVKDLSRLNCSDLPIYLVRGELPKAILNETIRSPCK